MRRLALAAALSALALAGCGGGPCQDLGEKLCSCVGAGTTKDACVNGVKDQLSSAGKPDAFCSEKLATCHEPSGAQFCEWIVTDCGKASCGISVESPDTACAQ